MPEQQKPTGGTGDIMAENGTGKNSPSKSPIIKGKMTFARVTLLDGTVKDFQIEVIIL